MSFLLVTGIAGLMALGLNACGGQSGFVEYLDLALSPGVDYDELQTAAKVNDRSAHTHRNGFHWHLYAVNAPMAWRMTRGKPELVVAAVDIWTDSLGAHPDLQPLHNGKGNFVISNGSDGSVQSYPLRNGHGLTVLGMAVAEGSSRQTQDAQAGGAMIGISPECRGMAVRMEKDIWQVDTDMTQNGRRVLPAVCNVSLVDNNRENYRRIVNSGVVLVSAAGNSRSLPQFATTVDTVIADEDELEDVKLRYSRTLYPAAFNFVDSAAPQDWRRDSKVIAVAGVRDGNVACSDSSVCGGEYYGCRYNDGWTWRGPLQFVSNWNFSTGTDKFNVARDAEVRIRARERAFVDLVAPANPLMSLSGDSATYGFSSGTSQAAPLVAGTAGLMLSIDRTLGLGGGFDTAGVYSGGAALQRRAYDILTFTASKLADSDNMYYSFKPGYGYHTKDYRGRKVYMAIDNMDGSPIQYEYLTQANDPLRRSWAQRVGFGMLDVYRAVAHSIPTKARGEYFSEQVLDFGPVEKEVNRRRLMHMGAWRPAEGLQASDGTQFVAVLDSGGVSLPGETHNNQGLTLLHEGCRLVVDGADQMLAIDGIVRSVSSRDKQEEITSRNGAVIMAAGRTEDVRLQGSLCLGNLTVSNTADLSNPVNTNSIVLEGENSELHGELTLEDAANCLVKSGTTTVHPGARIRLNGHGWLRINSGASLHMRYGSQINAKTSPEYLNNPRRKAEVHNKVIIEQDAKITCSGIVNLHAFLELLPGAELHLFATSKVSCDSIFVHPGARILIHPGAHLALRKDLVCQGAILTDNSTDGTSFITGRFPEIEIDIDKVRCQDVVAPVTVRLDGFNSTARLTLKNIQTDGIFVFYSSAVDISLDNAQVRVPRKFTQRRGAIIMADNLRSGNSEVQLNNTHFLVSGTAGFGTSSLNTALYLRKADKYSAESVSIDGLKQEVIKTDRPYVNRDLIYD